MGASLGVWVVEEVEVLNNNYAHRSTPSAKSSNHFFAMFSLQAISVD